MRAQSLLSKSPRALDIYATQISSHTNYIQRDPKIIRKLQVIQPTIKRAQQSYSGDQQSTSQAIGFIFKGFAIMSHHHKAIGSHEDLNRLMLENDV